MKEPEISQETQTELALRKSERLFRTLVEAQSEGLAIIDTGERFLFANRAAEETFGVPPGTLVGRDLLDFVSLETTGFIREQTKTRLEGKRSEYEVEIIRERDGAKRTLLVSATPQFDDLGNVSGTLGLFRDITERKRHEEALQESEERLRLATESTRLGTFDLYPQLGKRIWSPLLKDFFGLPRDQDVTDEVFHQTVHPEDRDRVFGGIRDLMKIECGGESVLEFRVIGANDGKERWLCSWGRSFFDSEGKAIRTIGVTQDITERKRAEREHERLQGQLLQSQKMESIGRLAGGVAHDFNNLLMVINGYASLALGYAPQEGALRDAISEIRRAGEQAAGMVQQLLAFSRKQILRQEIVNLNDVVRGMESMLSRLMGEDIEIVTSLMDRLDRVVVDRHQMEQVMLNLAVNARDAMPHGGKLAIETGHETWKRRCPHCGAEVQPGRYVQVTVRDSGTGMDEFTRSHLFEPFFTTKAMDKGTGLGLATVEGIILQSGGHIDVESEPGQGTVFYIYLPAVEAQPETREAPAAAEAARGTETILLVEDQPAVRQLAALFLQEYGYRAFQASGGEEALSHCAAQPIDLLLTDVVMPHMSGTELAKRVRTLQPSVKVLFMSGHSEEVLAGHTDGSTRPPLIQKPFTLKALAAKVREVLEDRG